MAGVASFQVHEEYSRSLLEHLHRPPPPKFDPPGIDSLLRADREMWIRVSEQVKSDFTGPGKSGVVDSVIQTWQHSMQVAYFLVPVPKPDKPDRLPGKRSWEQSFKGEDKGTKGKGKGKFMSQAWQSGKSGKGKSGKGKDKTQTSVPAALKGLDPIQPQPASRLPGRDMADGPRPQLSPRAAHLHEVSWRSFLLSLRQVTATGSSDQGPATFVCLVLPYSG